MSGFKSKQDIAQKIFDMGSKINELRSKSSQTRGGKKAELDQHINDLQEKKDNIQKKLDESNSQSKSNDVGWGEIASSFQSAWDEFNQAFEKARNKLK
jgi:hypothetical protein